MVCIEWQEKRPDDSSFTLYQQQPKCKVNGRECKAIRGEGQIEHFWSEAVKWWSERADLSTQRKKINFFAEEPYNLLLPLPSPTLKLSKFCTVVATHNCRRRRNSLFLKWNNRTCHVICAAAGVVVCWTATG